jgi:hypothetical protein
LNEQYQRQSEKVDLDALVVEVGKTRSKEGQDVPFTVFYLGRWFDNLTLYKNGLAVGEKVQIRGEIVDTVLKFRSGKEKRVQFIAGAELLASVAK